MHHIKYTISARNMCTYVVYTHHTNSIASATFIWRVMCTYNNINNNKYTVVLEVSTKDKKVRATKAIQ